MILLIRMIDNTINNRQMNIITKLNYSDRSQTPQYRYVLTIHNKITKWPDDIDLLIIMFISVRNHLILSIIPYRISHQAISCKMPLCTKAPGPMSNTWHVLIVQTTYQPIVQSQHTSKHCIKWDIELVFITAHTPRNNTTLRLTGYL